MLMSHSVKLTRWTRGPVLQTMSPEERFCSSPPWATENKWNDSFVVPPASDLGHVSKTSVSEAVSWFLDEATASFVLF